MGPDRDECFRPIPIKNIHSVKRATHSTRNPSEADNNSVEWGAPAAVCTTEKAESVIEKNC
jgi:hypothetical protein